MTYYYSSRWNENKMNLELCPYCGYSQSLLKENPFEKKLIRALNHPEPITIVWAIKILGELKSKNVLLNLFGIIKTSHDSFIVAEAVKSVMLTDSEKSSLKKLEDSIKIELGILNPLTRK